MAKEQMQHEARQSYTYYDQHGRAYHAIVDTRAKPRLAPCTPLIPEGWSAPVMPPGHYLKPHPVRIGTLVIQYDRWYDEAVESEAAWLKTLQQRAQELYGPDSAKKINDGDPILFASVGFRPQSSRLVKAAELGNKWALGLEPLDQVPSWAEPLLDTLPQFRIAAQVAEEAEFDFPSLAEERARAAGESLDTGATSGARATDEDLNKLFASTS